MKQLCIKHKINKVIRYSQVRNEYRCSYHHCRFLGNVLWEHPVNQCRWSCKFSNTRLWLSGPGETNPRIIKSYILFQFSITYITLAQLTKKATKIGFQTCPFKRRRKKKKTLTNAQNWNKQRQNVIAPPPTNVLPYDTKHPSDN